MTGGVLSEFTDLYEANFGAFPGRRMGQAEWNRFSDSLTDTAEMHRVFAQIKADRVAGKLRHAPMVCDFESVLRGLRWGRRTADSPGAAVQAAIDRMTPAQRFMANCRYNSLVEFQRLTTDHKRNLCRFVGANDEDAQRAEDGILHGCEGRATPVYLHIIPGWICLMREVMRRWAAVPALRAGEQLLSAEERHWFDRVSELALHRDDVFAAAKTGVSHEPQNVGGRDGRGETEPGYGCGSAGDSFEEPVAEVVAGLLSPAEFAAMEAANAAEGVSDADIPF